MTIVTLYQEFLLDLDSHKSLVVSLNIVGKHLAEHTEDETRAREMTERLAGINRRWEAVCSAAAVWETRLQTSLLQVHTILYFLFHIYFLLLLR